MNSELFTYIYDAAKPLCGFRLSINSYDCNKAILYKINHYGMQRKTRKHPSQCGPPLGGLT